MLVNEEDLHEFQNAVVDVRILGDQLLAQLVHAEQHAKRASFRDSDAVRHQRGGGNEIGGSLLPQMPLAAREHLEEYVSGQGRVIEGLLDSHVTLARRARRAMQLPAQDLFPRLRRSLYVDAVGKQHGQRLPTNALHGVWVKYSHNVLLGWGREGGGEIQPDRPPRLAPSRWALSSMASSGEAFQKSAGIFLGSAGACKLKM